MSDITKAEKEQIIQELLESDKIKQLYDDYIIQSLSYEEWVRNTFKYLIKDNWIC